MPLRVFVPLALAMAAAAAPLSIDNGLLSVQFDASKNTFAVSARGVRFVREGKLSGAGGQARRTTVASPLSRTAPVRGVSHCERDANDPVQRSFRCLV